jgi:DNA-directed RNA polymerase beta' subunit
MKITIDLYERLIFRSNRLKRLLELGAPDEIICTQKRWLQKTVNLINDNLRQGKSLLIDKYIDGYNIDELLRIFKDMYG